ncbi:LCP family protein [Paenibacillus shunpengii]|uniref:LCP family protein n=1 Tax=Paenibacillus shunpengii TaxID=2054424 RepID=A0ABW5SUK3_9BACL|nr:LCP family protein [Paenibacillus sp. FSL H7-0326]
MSDLEYPLTRSNRKKAGKNKKAKKKTKKPLIISFIILLLVGSFAYIFHKELGWAALQLFVEKPVKTALDDSYEPLDEVTGPAVTEEEKELEPFSMLLLGVDEREGDVGRSDTMIYAVFRPEDHRMLLLSIPRDSYVQIAGRDRRDKVNAAYAYGGAKMSVETIEQLLETDVDYYAKVNFNALVEVVDALGGVELPITEPIQNKYKYHIPLYIEANKPIYTGEDALNYVRYREDSDFKRTERQRIFLKAAAERMLQIGNITKIPEILSIASSNMKTDMTSDFILDLGKLLYDKEAVPQMTSYMLEGSGKSDGAWYYMLDDDKLDYAQQLVDNWTDASITSDQLMDPEKDEEQTP